jgi:hypothetical protein
MIFNSTSRSRALGGGLLLWRDGFLNSTNMEEELGLHSRYSDWLRAGRSRGRGSSPGSVKNFLFSTSSRPAVGSTQPPIQWVPGTLSPGVKRSGREADHSPPAIAEVK